MDNKTRPLHLLSTRDSLQIKRQIQALSKGIEKIFHENGNLKNWGSNTYTRQDKFLKTKAITRDKKEPNNCTSGNLSKEIQNTKLKRRMYRYVHYSIIYNSQDMEAS